MSEKRTPILRKQASDILNMDRLVSSLPRFVNDLLATLFGKRSFLTFRKNIQHDF